MLGNNWRNANNSVRLPDINNGKIPYGDSSIGNGMDISILGGIKDPGTDSQLSGDQATWRRSKPKKNDSAIGSMEKIDYDPKDYDDVEGIKHVDEIMYDPEEEIVVMDCCPPGCYRVCPCCIGDPDSLFWQLWYKHRLQVSRQVDLV